MAVYDPLIDAYTFAPDELDFAIPAEGSLAATVIGNALGNSITGDSIDNTLIGGAGDDVLTGESGEDSLDGGAGNDTLIGGMGEDTLAGGLNDDTYIVDSTRTVLVESAGNGADVVRASIDFALGANFEELVLTGNGFRTGNGNSLNNKITGNDAANWLNGEAGSDTLIGGKGDDTYIIDDTDTIVENANEGKDTVRIHAGFVGNSFTLGNQIEDFFLEITRNFDVTGNALNNQIYGSSGDDTLRGEAGDDTLVGADGADVLIGGTGNDTYHINSTVDVMIEVAGGGTADSVVASIDYVLQEHFENLRLTGTSNLNGTGNGEKNTINGNNGQNILTGGGGNDILIGGGGADLMIGGIGNDLYHVDSTHDVVTEDEAGGTNDQVVSMVSYTLGANFEYLALQNGAGNISGTGNALDNTMFGNNGNNVIGGGAGRDQLNGATGNDTVHGGDGNDTINESGDGNDVLNGGTGNDDLRAEGGNDLLTGGKGKDIFVFDTKLNKKTNLDKITDFSVRDDSIQLDNAIFKKIGKGTPFKPGKLNKAFFALDKAKDKNDYVIYNKKKGVLSFDADGSGKAKATDFAILKKGLSLTAADFFVI